MVPGKPLRVLVVDDEPDILEVVAVLLKSRLTGAEVETAHGGPQAIAMIDAAPPDVVVTDYRMPDVNGLQVMRHAVKHGVAATIMLTAYPDVDVAIGALNEGHAAHFFVKPPEPNKLTSAVQGVLDDLRAGRTREAAFERARQLALKAAEEK